MTRAELNALQLAYDDFGRGAAVVLLHGGGCDRSFWAPQIARLAEDFRVIVPDLRAHGESETPAGDCTMEVFADDVAELCHHLGTGPVVVVGHSLGGVVAYVMAARHPGLVEGVAALDSPILVSDEVAKGFSGLVAATEDPSFPEVALAQTAAALPSTLGEDIRAKILESQGRVDPTAFRSMVRDVYSNRFSEHLKGCKARALYVSATLPVDLDGIARLCPGIRLEQLQGLGHFVGFEAPERVADLIHEFALEVVSRRDR